MKGGFDVYLDGAAGDQVGDLFEFVAAWFAAEEDATHAGGGGFFLRRRADDGDKDAAGFDYLPGAILCVAALGVEDDIDIADYVFEFGFAVVDDLIGSEVFYVIGAFFRSSADNMG